MEINECKSARWIQGALKDDEVREAIRRSCSPGRPERARKVMPMKPRLFDRPVGVLSARSANPVSGKCRRMAARFVGQALSLSIGLLLCLPAHIEAADLRKVAKQGKMVLQERCGRTRSKLLGKARSRKPRRCATSTPGSIHASCKQSSRRAWFPSTGKCHRSNSPMKTSARS